MKNYRKIIALALAVLLCAAFAGCENQGGGETTPPTTTSAPLSAHSEYRVTVADAAGNPFTTGVIVRFLQGGEQAAMVPVNENGVAAKTLPRGDYAVELMFTGDESEYHYEAEGLNLTSSETELTVTLSYTVKDEGRTLFGWSVDGSQKEFTAYAVGEGSTYVSLSAEDRVYYLFTPTRAGTYEIFLEGSAAVLGYYGAPHFVQQLSVSEAVDNKITVSIKASMIGTNGTGTTVLVLGIDPAQEENCVLNVIRTGDPKWTIEDEPWHIYQAATKPVPYVHSGAALQEFDLTASTGTYNLVLGADGYYHLNSETGPLVLMRLGKNSGGSQYLSDFQTILEYSGVVKYFFDADGQFVKKESYSECLLEYIACADEATGLYPLTEDLKYIICSRGEYVGWFDPASSMYVFKTENGTTVNGINNEIGWLFMCCYAE